MLEPTGPLPAAVYWRRRAVALAGLVVVVFVLIWLVASGGDDNQVQPAAQQMPTATTAPPTSEIGFATTAVSSETTTSSSSVTTTTSVTPSPTTTPSPTPTPTGPPQPCPDEVTRVVAEPQQPQYKVGERPVFRLSVTNTGTVPCVRDLDASLQEVLVYASDGTTRLWSSNDCYPGDSNDVRTLKPGESALFSVTWAGRSSQPGCAGQRVPVPAGDYLVVGKLGALTSAPAPFRLVN